MLRLVIRKGVKENREKKRKETEKEKIVYEEGGRKAKEREI